MPFLFKIVAILIGIFIWKTVFASFMKMKSAMHDESGDDEDSKPRARQDLEEQWRQTATNMCCTFNPGEKPNGSDMCITGRCSGHAITIKWFGRNYVRYFVAFRNATRIQVCVVRDIQTVAERILDGHPIFPSKMFFSSQEPDFYCSAESEEAFDRFLETPSNRSAVLNLVRLFPAAMFNNEGVSVRLRATVPDSEVLLRMLTIASALEKPSQTPMPDLLIAQKKGLLSVPADFPSVLDAHEEDAPKRFPPLQVQVEPSKRTSRIKPQRKTEDFAASSRTVVIPIPPEAKPASGADAVKSGVVRNSTPSAPSSASSTKTGRIRGGGSASSTASASSAQRMPAEPEKSPVPVQCAAIADDMTVESDCTVLFAKSFPGAEERAAFDAMKGRRVRWNGELQMVLPFSMDFTFGSGKGVKATFLVHEMKQGQSAFPVKIKAVAAFPPELQATLEAAKGKTVSFEGDLLKFEPFAREIFLQNASLES